MLKTPQIYSRHILLLYVYLNIINLLNKIRISSLFPLALLDIIMLHWNNLISTQYRLVPLESKKKGPYYDLSHHHVLLEITLSYDMELEHSKIYLLDLFYFI